MSLMSSFKGIVGETVINVAMWLKLDKDVYHRLNNITLPLADGGSTQIDHVIVSRYGIFVIETKNYKGWIYGNERQRQWTQAFPNGRKYKFQNPLHQNYLHIKTLSDLLELEMSYFHSMIAFIGECELKTRDELPEHVLTSGMVSYIKKKQNKILNDGEVKAIVEQIESNRFSKSWRTNRAHKAYLKDKHSNASKSKKLKLNASLTEQSSPQADAPIRTEVKEYARWSGQTQVEQSDFNTSTVPSINVLPSTEVLNNNNNVKQVFITPFKIVESEPQTQQSSITKQPVTPVSNEDIPTFPKCPKCSGEMVQRIAKKGAHQGQHFFGCCQFPKCRGVINA
ncbi:MULTISPECIES: NERD domain-containing protein [unclassified Psychrobacter]|uniref:NERD domain-containing protein n=1 Tax=unclassified Psychrobacter TaxID=196806 RepID=UPI0025F82192|nr:MULTISPECIES: NERD domain-containing protein [unclassified Psychrobacter]